MLKNNVKLLDKNIEDTLLNLDEIEATDLSGDEMAWSLLYSPFSSTAKFDDALIKFSGNIRSYKQNVKSKVRERYDFMMKLKPKEFVVGSNGFRHYFGAKFSDELVAFENIEYGNAVYVMFKNWEMLSQLSRKELMNKYKEGKDFIRIVHAKGWKNKLKELIENYRAGGKIS